MDNQEVMLQISILVKKYFENNSYNFVSGKTKIPLAVPSYNHEEVTEAIDSLLSTMVTMGNKVKQFEKKFAKYTGRKYAIMVNSGSSANLLSLAILTNPKFSKKLNSGDEVITPALTWSTTVYPMVNNGLKPVFVDVDPETFCLDENKIEEAITKKTKAIMPVHLLGNTANMSKIQEIADRHDLFIIEDSCEAHGAEFNKKKIGSFGDMSTFSFFLSHHITTIEGGMLLTDNDELYELGKSLRAFGWIRDLDKKDKIKNEFPHIDPRFLFLNMGFNMRPTEIQGAFGIHQIDKLEKFIQIRTENAQFWNKKLDKYSSYLQLPKELPNSRHAYFGYSILIKNDAPFSQKQFGEFLESKNIEVRPIMAGNIVEQPSSQLYEYKISNNLTNSTYIMKNGLFLPNHHMIGTLERQYILDTITEFIEKRIWENN
jgi:CDP-6-deoxy-D-xylo-4-hexulose-3-dehydrase